MLTEYKSCFSCTLLHTPSVIGVLSGVGISRRCRLRVTNSKSEVVYLQTDRLHNSAIDSRVLK